MPGFGDALEFSLVFKGIDEVSNVLGDIAGALAGVITQTSGFDTALMSVRTNTTMTTADMEAMRKAILAINAQSGAPLDQLETDPQYR